MIVVERKDCNFNRMQKVKGLQRADYAKNENVSEK